MSLASLALLPLLLAQPARGEPVAPMEVSRLRAVEAPPDRWGQVFSSRRPVRLYWNGGRRFDVQYQTEGAWEILARGVESGWESRPLPRGTAFRLSGGEETSGTVTAPQLVPPAEIARLSGPSSTLLGADVVDILPDGDGNTWIATLGGGLSRVDAATGEVMTVTRSDGLPSNRVVAISPYDGAIWGGTSRGLARLGPGLDPAVTEVLGEEQGLPDDYVQALLGDGDQLWIGTYRGLARLRGGEVRRELTPWSVFSLTWGTDRRVWVGYEGLLGLPAREPIEGIPPTIDIYDVEVLPRAGTLVASPQEGLSLLHEGERRVLWSGRGDDGAYAIARVGTLVLAAGAQAGLVALDLEGNITRSFTEDDGLPSAVVNEVVPDRPWSEDPQAMLSSEAGAVWVGTDRGAFRLDAGGEVTDLVPLARIPAGRQWTSVIQWGRRWALAGPDGLAWLGPPRAGDGARARRAGSGLVSALRARGSRWYVRADHVEQVLPGGARRRHLIPGPIAGAVVAGGRVWVGGSQGLFLYQPSSRSFAPLPGTGEVERLRAGEDGLLWVIASQAVISVDQDLKARWYMGTHRPLDLWPDEGLVWVGTVNGIDVIHRSSGDVLDLLRRADQQVVVTAIAADGAGGCWAATEAGQILHLDTRFGGQASIRDLEPGHPPAIHEIRPVDQRSAWVLTDRGVAAVYAELQR